MTNMIYQKIDSNAKISKSVKIGNFTIIGPYVHISEGSVVWHFANIYGQENKPVIIGENTQVGSYAQIKPDVKIGNNCRLQDHLSIPEGITIEDYVFVGPGVVFTNDKYPTIVSTLNSSWELEKTIIQSYSSIGAGSIIGPGITIGYKSIIGMGSVVTKDVPEKSIVVGNPAREIGKVDDEKFIKIYKELLGID